MLANNKMACWTGRENYRKVDYIARGLKSLNFDLRLNQTLRLTRSKLDNAFLTSPMISPPFLRGIILFFRSQTHCWLLHHTGLISENKTRLGVGVTRGCHQTDVEQPSPRQKRPKARCDYHYRGMSSEPAIPPSTSRWQNPRGNPFNKTINV